MLFRSGGVVEASDDIVIEGAAEKCNILCGGTILFKNGVRSDGENYIEATVGIKGNFFEQVNIKCKDNIYANYFMNCKIITDGKVIATGRKGKIVGGLTYAMKGIEAFSVGNEAGIKTVLEVGKTIYFDNSVAIDTNKVEIYIRGTAFKGTIFAINEIKY